MKTEGSKDTNPPVKVKKNSQASSKKRFTWTKTSTATFLEPAKFKGNCANLGGHAFNCSDYKQANEHDLTVKRIAEHVGTNHENGSDVPLTIENETKFKVPKPIDPGDEAPKLKEMEFKNKVNSHVKCMELLDNNLTKACSLALGQCTELMKNKL